MAFGFRRKLQKAKLMNREYREIKFRFWDKKDGVMIDWLAVRQTAFNRDDLHLCYDLMGTDPNFIKMQFTGHQIKGSDLYDGDIVRLEENGEGVDPKDKITYYVCTWIQEWAMFALLRAADEYFEYINEGTEALDTTMFWTFPLDVEDIGPSQHYLCGNIYETPQLIEKQ